MHYLLPALLVVSFTLSSSSTELIPVLGALNQSRTAGGSSFCAAISSDARFVVFLSHANNLVTNDSMNPWMDVFLRNLANHTTTLISVDASGSGGGNDNSSIPTVSANGAWVAFASAARNLVPGDTNGFSDVFLRDVISGVTRVASRAPAPENAGGNGSSSNPLLSHDGRYVVYESMASNLVSGDINGTQDIFIYDAVLQSNRLVSAEWTFPNLETGQNGPSHSATMTPDGRYVAYVKSATNNLSEPPAVSHAEIFVRDHQASTTYWLSTGVSSNFAGGPAYACYNPTISANGGLAVFKANNGGLAAALYRRSQLSTPGVHAELIATNAATSGWAQVNVDGRFVAYEATDGIRVWDGQSGSNRLVMENIAGDPDRTCTQPAISADGNRTVFLVTSNRFSSVYGHDWASNSTKVAVVKGDGTPATVNESAGPLLSADGQSVVFDSMDGSLVEDDANRACDVFAFGMESGVMTLVSTRAQALFSITPPVASGRWPISVGPNGRFAAISTVDFAETDTNRVLDLYTRDFGTGGQTFLGRSTNSTGYPSFSADGRYVVYLSVDLSHYNPSGWPGRVADVYRRDLLTGEERLIHSPVPWDSQFPTAAISPDGSQVAFAARGVRVPPFNSDYLNIYVVDLNAGVTNMASVGFDRWITNRLFAGYGTSLEPAFSPDGRWLLFRSTASNLTTNRVDGYGLFARDLVRGRTLQLGSWYESPIGPIGFGLPMSVSADSRYVASVSYVPGAGSGFPERVNVYDLHTETRVLVPDSISARSVSLSAGGRWVAFDRSTNGPRNIYVRDMLLQTNELISMQAGTTEPATGSSKHPCISHDGRYVIFASDATNLVAGDANGAKDIFIRDRWRGVTMLASINRTGTGSGNGASLLPVLAADGRTVFFQSFASDLMEGDFNEMADVFVLRLEGPDTDSDGVEDDWEMAYFSTLARDGSGDFDNDGQTDLQEFRAGTNPTNDASILRVLTITSLGGGGKTVLWSATPGRTYQVQFKTRVDDVEWSELPGLVTAAGTTASTADPTSSGDSHRFYRVTLVR